jgi:hypothetical protein
LALTFLLGLVLGVFCALAHVGAWRVIATGAAGAVLIGLYVAISPTGEQPSLFAIVDGITIAALWILGMITGVIFALKVIGRRRRA